MNLRPGRLLNGFVTYGSFRKDGVRSFDVNEMKKSTDLSPCFSGKDNGTASVAVRKSLLSRR
jgi:hypothetical protein